MTAAEYKQILLDRQIVTGKHGDKGYYVTTGEGHVAFIVTDEGEGAHGKGGTYTRHGVESKIIDRHTTKADVERKLVKAHNETGGNAIAEHKDALSEDTGGDLGPKSFVFHKSLPGEIRQHIENNPAARRLFRTTDDPREAGGADALAAMGDKYFQFIDDHAGNTLNAAKESARKSNDPETQFLAALHDVMPDKGGYKKTGEGANAKREFLKNADYKKTGLIAAEHVKPGMAWTIHGNTVEVYDHPVNGPTLRGDAFPETPVFAMEHLPIDHDSLTYKKVKAKRSQAYYSGDPIPFARTITASEYARIVTLSQGNLFGATSMGTQGRLFDAPHKDKDGNRGRWVTISGAHIFIRSGETTKDAIRAKFGDKQGERVGKIAKGDKSQPGPGKPNAWGVEFEESNDLGGGEMRDMKAKPSSPPAKAKEEKSPFKTGRDTDPTPTKDEIAAASKNLEKLGDHWYVKGMPTPNATKHQGMAQAIRQGRHKAAEAAGIGGNYPDYQGNFRDVMSDAEIRAMFPAEEHEAILGKTEKLASSLDRFNAKHGEGLTDADRVPMEMQSYTGAAKAMASKPAPTAKEYGERVAKEPPKPPQDSQPSGSDDYQPLNMYHRSYVQGENAYVSTYQQAGNVGDKLSFVADGFDVKGTIAKVGNSLGGFIQHTIKVDRKAATPIPMESDGNGGYTATVSTVSGHPHQLAAREKDIIKVNGGIFKVGKIDRNPSSMVAKVRLSPATEEQYANRPGSSPVAAIGGDASREVGRAIQVGEEWLHVKEVKRSNVYGAAGVTASHRAYGNFVSKEKAEKLNKAWSKKASESQADSMKQHSRDWELSASAYAELTKNESHIITLSATTLAPSATDGLPMKTATGQPVRYYWAESLKVGKWHTPKGVVLDVTPAMLSRLEENANLALSRGVEMPIVLDHAMTADKTAGYVAGVKREGDSLHVLHAFIGHNADDLASKNKVSLGLDPNYRDSFGNRYGWGIHHSALTNRPVIHGLSGFRPAA